jgi:hypothetical protein
VRSVIRSSSATNSVSIRLSAVRNASSAVSHVASRMRSIESCCSFLAAIPLVPPGQRCETSRACRFPYRSRQRLRATSMRRVQDRGTTRRNGLVEPFLRDRTFSNRNSRTVRSPVQNGRNAKSQHHSSRLWLEPPKPEAAREARGRRRPSGVPTLRRAHRPWRAVGSRPRRPRPDHLRRPGASTV